MKKLNRSEMENIEGGNALGCASAIATTLGVTLSAAAVSGGVGLAAWLLLKAGSMGAVINECSQI